MLAPEGAADVPEDGGISNATFLMTAGSNFFSSSNFCRSLAIASASRSCFSHFENDFECRMLGEAIGDVLESDKREIRLLLPLDGRSNGLPLETGLAATFMDFDTRAVFEGVPHNNCFPALAGELRSWDFRQHCVSARQEDKLTTTATVSEPGLYTSPRSSAAAYSSSLSQFSTRTSN